MAELITVQLGNYANFVGSHYWNIQDEVIGCSSEAGWSNLAPTLSSEVVCAWNENRYGEVSYAPRTVAVDLSGSLGGVSFDRAAADLNAAAAAAHSAVWAGGVQVQQAPNIAKSRYRQHLEEAGQLDGDLDDPEWLEAQQQALEAAAAELHAAQSTPRYWTDYLQVDLADSCVLTLSGSWHGQRGWAGWGVSGSSSSSVRDLVDAAVDRVRWWAEQCDRMQGLQLLADDLGGWGGICYDVLQQLRDQYPSQPVLYFSLQQQQQQQAAQGSSPGSGLSAAQIRRLLSNSLSLCEVPQLASLYVPLEAGQHSSTGPRSSSSSSSSFNTAAVLAAAIDTVTLPLRCTDARSALGAAQGATDLHSLVHLLSGPAANLAAASLQLPAPYLPTSDSRLSGQQQQQQAAQAAAGGNSSSSSRSAADGLTLNGAGCSSLSPGVLLTPDHCLAESVTLRGARTAAGLALCPLAAAKQALDTLLLQRQQQAVACRCVVHSCLSPMPLAAPVSFPSYLLPPPRPSGGQSALQGAQQASLDAAAAVNPVLVRSAKAPSVPAPGVFSRLTASSGFESQLQKAARDLQRLGGYGPGRACLEEWGYAASDVDELRENLLLMAGKYSTDLD